MLNEMKMRLHALYRVIKEINQVSKWYCFYIILEILWMGIGVVATVYIPKMIVDDIIMQSPMRQLIGHILLLATVLFLNQNCTSLLDTKVKKTEYIVADRLKQKIGDLVMNLKFIHLETPEVLNQYEVAYKSLLQWSGGIEAVSQQVIQILGNVIAMIGILAIIIKMKFWFSFVLILFVLLSILIEKKKASYDVPFFSQMVKYNREFNYYTKIMKDFTFAKEIRLYNTNHLIQEHTDAYQEYSDDIFRTRAKQRSICSTMGALVTGIFHAVMYLFLAVKTIANSLSIGNFVLLSGAYSNFINAASSICWNYFSLSKTLHFIGLFFGFYDQYSKELEESDAYRTEQFIEQKTCVVEFQHVWFRYRDGSDWILKDINLTFSSEEKVSIVGKNGAGKTTLIKLFVGLYQPTKGRITVNGVDVQNIPDAQYKSIASTVFQDFQIFAASVKENIIMSHEYNEKSFWQALDEVDMKKHIEGLAEKEETSATKFFDDEGVDFSGGQRQRLAIARALYRPSRFLVLDEPTSALDPKTEYDIYSRIKNMKRDRGIIFISHRLSSCKYSDQILVMDNGCVVQCGNHDTLIKDSKSQYYELFMSQAYYYLESGVE